jgi:hypothetical protein
MAVAFTAVAAMVVGVAEAIASTLVIVKASPLL